MNILVTGGAGYIGSHFVLQTIDRGFVPVVYDNLSMGHRWAVQTDRFFEADLADRRTLAEALKGVDAVVHFAASTYVGESVEDPSKYFNNNYINTIGLLDAIVAAGVKYFIFSSTCAVYGEPEKVPITEDEGKHPINPYGLSKHFIEESLHWYTKAYGLKYVSLRYFNAAGADPQIRVGEVHEPETHLIPLVLMAALGKREHIEIFGDDYPTPDGTCIRDYIHVVDLVDAHIKALEYLKGGGNSIALNLGTGSGTSVKELITAAESITGLDIQVKNGARRPGDPPLLVADSTRARDILKWRPVYERVDDAVAHAWQWMQVADKKGYLK